jgi:threonine synthase
MSSVQVEVTTLVCHGCGYRVRPDERHPFRCPNAGRDDADHVLQRRIDLDPEEREKVFHDHETDPFIRYRRLTHAWHTAMANGMTDAKFISIVRELEDRMCDSFRLTPFYEQNRLAFVLDLHADLWVKNETHNVAGSHKARHLMGIAIWLAVIDPDNRQRLAIASCGNAALAAATVAMGLRRPIDVYLSADADDAIVGKLMSLGANVQRCERRSGEHGDPAYLRFREAVERGALPFTVQGNENALAIEGGETLGWEMISQLKSNRATLDRLFVQVGGGALASSIIAAFEDAKVPLPRIHAVQTAVAPLKRAFDRVDDLQYAVSHRPEFMWPWENPVRSVASGLLDDETYDWVNIVRGMRESGGFPIVVTEEQLLEANRLAIEATGIRATPTGTAGLAGLLQLQHAGALDVDETLGVIFT